MSSRIRFEALFKDHAGAVRTYAARRIGFIDADDVVAEVFVIAWRRLEDLPEDPLPWLLGVARRVLANKRRAEVRRSAMHDRLLTDAYRATQSQAPEPTDGAIAVALARLSDSDREILLLTAWEGLGHAAVARVLGIRTGTLTVRLHRARRRLARLLVQAERGAPAPTQMEVL